jgi:hypothetical protein
MKNGQGKDPHGHDSSQGWGAQRLRRELLSCFEDEVAEPESRNDPGRIAVTEG